MLPINTGLTIFKIFKAKIVSENFFGGFQDKDDPEARKKNRKQWIDEMIAKSKQIKVRLTI